MIASFGAVYLIWGSTYLAIAYAIASFAPWGLSSLRFIVAGLLMWGIARLRNETALTGPERRDAALSGTLLVIANGLVCVAERWIPSGIAAVVIGAMPIWILLLGWVAFSGPRPTAQRWLGALVGLAGIALIATEHSGLAVAGPFGSFSVLILFASNWLWVGGTFVQRRSAGLKSSFRYSATQMLCGAVLAGALSLTFESPWHGRWAAVSASSWAALAYLIVFGSVIGFSAYGWLARNVEPHRVSTYALVNPVIAVGLGWSFRGERVTLNFLFATLLVLLGLVLLSAGEMTRAWRGRGPTEPRLPS